MTKIISKPRIILIGGPAGAGKSTLALELAYKMKIKQIVDLDTVREVLRGEHNKTNDPYLFSSSYEAWKLEGSEDSESIIRAFEKYSLSLKKAVDRIIERVDVLGKDTIIEGVHIVPSFYKKYIRRKNTRFIMLTPANAKVHKNNFIKRRDEFHGMDIQEYFDNFEKINIINKYLINDAKKNKCQILVNDGKLAMVAN